MTEEEAVHFVSKAIRLAVDRDGSSGGIIRIYVIHKDGTKSIVLLPKDHVNHDATSTSTARLTTNAKLSNFAPAKRYK